MVSADIGAIPLSQQRQFKRMKMLSAQVSNCAGSVPPLLHDSDLFLRQSVQLLKGHVNLQFLRPLWH